jgi:hypothetical protein
MSRRIVSKSLQANIASQASVDTYFDRVVKYIPSDVVAAWIAASGLITAAKTTQYELGKQGLWTVFLVGLAFAALWTWKQTAKPATPPPIVQTLVSAGAFAVWVFALGGPFPSSVGLYNPVKSSLVLIAYTLGVALINP